MTGTAIHAEQSVRDKVRQVGKGQIPKGPCILCTSVDIPHIWLALNHASGPSVKVTFLTIASPSPPTLLHTSSPRSLSAPGPFPLWPLSQLWLYNYLCDYVINNLCPPLDYMINSARVRRTSVLFSSPSQGPPSIASAQNIQVYFIK